MKKTRRVLTKKVGKVPRLTVKLDGNEQRIEENEDDDEPVKRLRFDDVTHFESRAEKDIVAMQSSSVHIVISSLLFEYRVGEVESEDRTNSADLQTWE